MITFYNLAFLDSIVSIWSSVTDWIYIMLQAVINLLPNSPFASISIPTSLSNVLGYINYVIPVANIVKVTALWVTAIVTYYVILLILRWVKVVS